MLSTFKEFGTESLLEIADQEKLKEFEESVSTGLFTFLRSRDEAIELLVDSVPILLPPNSIVALTPIQRLRVINPADALIYQFNREFYCIKDHDKEVGCAGLLFFGNEQVPLVQLDDNERQSFDLLHMVILEELEQQDNIQAEMLRMLMARFIIKTTRLFKRQSESLSAYASQNELLRQFNMLVDTHFKTEHSVVFYANLLHRSPKTLSNVFGKMNISPLRIIHDRITLEAKRMLRYSDMSSKTIAYELGFDDPSHLSRLFKKVTGISPSVYKSQLS